MIHVGIVGFGGMGYVHFRNYERMDGVRVVAAVSSSESGRRKAEEAGVRCYDTIGEMVEKEDIQVIDVCTPTFLHKQHVMEALNLNKHCIVEKPMALHGKDAQFMFDLAKEKNRLLFVAQVLQFTKEMDILRHFVRSGEIGKPLDGYFLRSSGKPGWSQDGWLFQKEKSGVIPFDLHIHDLDMIVSLFGKPRKYSYIAAGNEGIGYKEHYRVSYDYEGFSIAAEAAWYNADYPFTQMWRVYFEKGLLVEDKEGLILYQKDKAPRKFDTSEEILVSTGINLPPTGMFYRELSHFLDCIREGIPSDKVPREQILTSISLLEEMVFNAPEDPLGK